MSGITVDIYSASLHILQIHNNPTLNSSLVHGVITRHRKSAWRDVVYGPKPVDIDFWHNLSLLWPVFLSTFAIICFLCMTIRMQIESQDGALDGAFMHENGSISASPSAVLWTSLFVASLGCVHAFFIPVIICPAIAERIVLCWFLMFLPLAVMCQPSSNPDKAAGYAYTHGSRYDDDYGPRKAIPACGIRTSWGSVIALILAVYIIALWIEYDPDSYRMELLLVVSGVDLFILGLGHLWDRPPSIGTILNARIAYCVCILIIIAIVFPHTMYPGGFSVEFTDPDTGD